MGVRVPRATSTLGNKSKRFRRQIQCGEFMRRPARKRTDCKPAAQAGPRMNREQMKKKKEKEVVLWTYDPRLTPPGGLWWSSYAPELGWHRSDFLQKVDRPHWYPLPREQALQSLLNLATAATAATHQTHNDNNPHTAAE